MSCVLYKEDGSFIRCEIGEVDYYLQNGYQKDHPELKREPELSADELAIKEKEGEIRALAKEKGIARVGKKSIDTLLAELEELEAKEDAGEN